MKNTTDKKSEWGETIRVLIYALVLAFLVRAFFIQPFNIPSGSMKSTLLIGDYLFVSKLSYGYSNHSFPFSPPLFNGRVLADQPERGDVAVFKLPTDNSTDYIKRVIGLPGDKIQIKNGVIWLNDKPIPRKPIKDFREEQPDGSVLVIKRYVETLPSGVKFTVLDSNENGYLDNTPVYKVPQGHYFMMGDNRDNSNDSRVISQVGYVPFENLVGKAKFLFFSVDSSSSIFEVWKWPTAIRWSRLFSGIK